MVYPQYKSRQSLTIHKPNPVVKKRNQRRIFDCTFYLHLLFLLFFIFIYVCYIILLCNKVYILVDT